MANDQQSNESESKLKIGRASLGSIVEDAKRVLTQPLEFYSTMPQSGGFSDPCIFLLVMAVIMGALATLVSIFGVGHLGSMVIGFGSIVVIPIMALIGSFIGALIMFVIWKLMGSEKDYETSYRCVAYASVVYPIMPLVGWVPYLGTVITAGLGMYLLYVATIQVQAIKPQRAQTVMGILAAVLIFMQLSGEYTARSFQQHFEGAGKEWQQNADEMSKALEGIGKNAEDMTPEDAGKALGEFLKGFSDAMPEEMKQRIKDAERHEALQRSAERAASDVTGEASTMSGEASAMSGEAAASEQVSD